MFLETTPINWMILKNGTSFNNVLINWFSTILFKKSNSFFYLSFFSLVIVDLV